MSSASEHWPLESFLDSLILELDKAQDTLAVKGVTRKLTYTVKDVALDLHVFPHYEHGRVRFATAGPGEEGASRLSLQLGSITDRQIRESTNDPISEDDVAIEGVEEIDPEVRQSLEKVGVKSSRDLERLERRRVDLPRIVSEKAPSKDVDYQHLASVIKRARRRRSAPRITTARALESADGPALVLEGRDLAIDPSDPRFPMAMLNGEMVPVLDANERRVRIGLPEQGLAAGSNQVEIALDPQSYLRMVVQDGDDS